MTKLVYNWERFWRPRDRQIRLSDRGYLQEPAGPLAQALNPDLVTFDSVSKVPCLVLLGEPGIGKSHAMKAAYEAVKGSPDLRDDRVLYLDLRSYGSDIRLVQSLFESTEYKSWKEGNHRLHVFLDSLDECLLRVNALAAILVDEFDRYPVERLLVRIACRTAEWPTFLEVGLEQAWEKSNVGVYELAPLRHADVIEAAHVNELDSEAFLQEIDDREAMSLAIRPIALNLLINIFRRSGKLPSRRVELYHQGCRLMCKETSSSRLAAGLVGEYSADQRLAAAARIAAGTVFGQRYAIWTDMDSGDVPDEDVTIQELSQEFESAGGTQFEVTESVIRETLATGLFSSRGPRRMGWAHQTYAEFLAAHCLVEHQMPLTQMMSLIVHPEDPDLRLIPQLHETAAWLASLVPDVFREIMKKDPLVLLRSDVATADVQDRQALVDALLSAFDEEQILDTDWSMHLRYRKLSHPELAEQLRPLISDSSKGYLVRRVAVDIAEACVLDALQHDLLEVILEPSESYTVRVNCVYAICRIGDEEAKARLKPLAFGEVGDDPDDELRGCCLLATWPDHVTAEELFAALVRPKRENFHGAYAGFLSSDFVQHIDLSDIPTALNWVEKQGPRREIPFDFRDVIDAIMVKAWKHLEFPGVLNAFARAAYSRLMHSDGISGHQRSDRLFEEIGRETKKRHRVVDALIPILASPTNDPLWLFYSRTPLVTSEDVPWTVERLVAEDTPERQDIWIELITRAFDCGKPQHLDAIFAASKRSSTCAKAFASILEPVPLNSPQAQRMRERYLKMQEWQEQPDAPPALEPLPSERVAQLLDQFETGNLAAWWRLNMEMTLESRSTHYGSDLEPDLTTLPGWTASDDPTRARIVDAAKRYILEQEPDTNQWLGTNSIHRPAFAGYRALQLLLMEDTDSLANIPLHVWRRWAPMVLAYPTPSSSRPESVQKELVAKAYHQAPNAIIQTLGLLIDAENKGDEHIFITRKVENCWDHQLANALLEKAQDPELKPECMGYLLRDLLDHGFDPARDFAEQMIPSPPPTDSGPRSRALVSARALLERTEDAGWATVWPAVQQDAEFGRTLVLSVVSGPERRQGKIPERLREDQLEDIYIWLARQFPHAEDPQHEGAHFVGPREAVAGWRDHILRHLQARGTHEACVAIERIVHELPELDSLKWVLLRAKSTARQHTWKPPRPVDIIELVRSQHRRLVQGGEQLLDVLVESLQRLETKLQGETPGARDIWDRTPKMDVFRPVDENSFSDYVKRHFDEDLKQSGVIVNREVEIRRGEGSGMGERTDIHVDAVLSDREGLISDTVTVIVEVKGCWHEELDDAMETQLANRYLKDNQVRHGLYLVGWFNCEQWDDEDGRQRSAPKIDRDEAQARFDEQASGLSSDKIQVKAFVMNTALR